MLDFSNRLGRRVDQRLQEEKIVWLTTVDARNTPQPRPVWFHWDGQTVLIFSQKNKAKLRHISRSPRVSLNFNTNDGGGDVAVLLGDASIPVQSPDPNRIKSYLRKYREGIEDLGMTVAEFTEVYSVAILVAPQVMRGFTD